jgi:hypothetical protein
MKPTILAPILAVALLSVLAVPTRVAAQVGGTGTAKHIPIWTSSTTLGDSIIFQTSAVGGGTTLQATGGDGLTGQFGHNGWPGGSIKFTGGHGGGAGTSVSGGPGGSVLITGGTGGSGTTCCAQNVNGNGGSITLQPGAGGTLVLTHGLPGNVILAPTRGKVGIRTATPTATLDVGAGGTTLADAWITRSARRFKTNIQPLERALEKIEQLQGVSYERKVDGRHEIGVVAEDVDQVVPEVVSRDPKTKQVQGVDYSRLAALLIEAVKSQQVEIQHLKAQIEQLTSNSVGQ